MDALKSCFAISSSTDRTWRHLAVSTALGTLAAGGVGAVAFPVLPVTPYFASLCAGAIGGAVGQTVTQVTENFTPVVVTQRVQPVILDAIEA